MEWKIFWRNLFIIKVPVFLVLSGIIWVLAGRFGFPIWWQIEFVAFAFVGLVFFIILDLPPLTPEDSAIQTL